MAAIKCLVVTVAALVILQTVGVLGSGENLSKWRHSRVIRFKSNGDAQTLEFLDFLSTLSSVQTWKINRGNIDVLVGDDVYQDVRIAAANRNIDISYDIPLDSLTNVTTAAPAALHKRLRNGRQVVSDLTHTKYYTLAEINQWLDDVASKCGDRCSLSTLGQTYNNNPLKILRVGANTGCTKEKIFIDCGIHAREWISPATCVYLVSRFLNDYGSDGQITALLDKYEWYFVPVMNPDGYDYTHTNDRMWRKNRAPSGKSRCPGIDLNRNWDVNFGGTGSSSNKCSETYHGSSPFSEPETKVYKDFIMANKPWHAYFTLHSYGQLILYPYGYTYDPAPTKAALVAAGEAIRTGIEESSGRQYELIPGSDLYPAAGCSDDWAYAKADIPYAYTIELRSTASFIIGVDQIIPTGQEILSGLLKFIKHQEDNGIVQAPICNDK